MVNSFNPVQLSAWRANVDMQYIVSRRRVIDYCTKSEPRSETLKDTFARIVRGLKEGNQSLKAVQKLLIHSVGDRNYSAQETCYNCPCLGPHVTLLSSAWMVIQHHDRATAPSILDHYTARPAAPHLDSITLLEFVRQFTMPKELGAEPNRRSKKVVVIARPYCKPFHQVSELLAGYETYYAEAYAEFLQTENIPPSLEEDIFCLQQLQASQDTTKNEVTDFMYLVLVIYLPISAILSLELTNTLVCLFTGGGRE